ncbi:rubrerythrin [Clostridium sporogenes]|nr:rubrerythrin [Clostridium sporogenes]NFG69291.1 rubrerythrin [Clostridium sporogenes]
MSSLPSTILPVVITLYKSFYKIITSKDLLLIKLFII